MSEWSPRSSVTVAWCTRCILYLIYQLALCGLEYGKCNILTCNPCNDTRSALFASYIEPANALVYSHHEYLKVIGCRGEFSILWTPQTIGNSKTKWKHTIYVTTMCDYINKQHSCILTITLNSPLGQITVINPLRSWWSYKIMWMTVESDRYIKIHCTSTPHLPTKSIVRSQSRVAKWGLWVTRAKWVHQMSSSYHSLIPLGSLNLSAHYTPMYLCTSSTSSAQPHLNSRCQ